MTYSCIGLRMGKVRFQRMDIILALQVFERGNATLAIQTFQSKQSSCAIRI